MTKLEEAISEAWKNAWEGGYEDFLREESVEEIAIDMMQFDEEVSWRCTDEEDVEAVEKIIEQLKMEYGCG